MERACATNEAVTAIDSAVRRTSTAAVLDVVVIVIFAAIGRASHSEAHPVLESLAVAWPFLVGAAVGWAIAVGPLHRTAASFTAGVPIWFAAVVVGMVLRVATGRGTAISFIIVATLFLGAFLLGWRVILLGWKRRTNRLA